MIEIYKDIPGYEGLYQVSNLGNVKSLKNYHKTIKSTILKSFIIRGYYRVELYKNGIGKQLFVHRLVAMTFIPNPNNHPQVNHKDENKLNNSVDNLEWCTAKYNINYGTGRSRMAIAQHKPVACFKDNKLVKCYESITDVEKDGHHPGNVSRCCNGIYKTHHGMSWSFIK